LTGVHLATSKLSWNGWALTKKGGAGVKKYCFLLIIALLIPVAMPGMVLADMVTQTFQANIAHGDYRGDQFGTGSFSYDTDWIEAGDFTLDPSLGLTVTFSFDGQNFNEQNDIDFLESPPDQYPQLYFSDFQPISLDYWLINGVNGVAFSDPNLEELYISGSAEFEDLGSGAAYDYKTVLGVEAVPIPAAIWLLGSGLIGLAGFRRRK
jgi:hypothetical protein